MGFGYNTDKLQAYNLTVACLCTVNSSPMPPFRSTYDTFPAASVIQGGAKRTHVFEMGGSRESFFLWGYLKSRVYIRKPRTVDDLKVSIRE